jgi:hypothetical protein
MPDIQQSTAITIKHISQQLTEQPLDIRNTPLHHETVQEATADQHSTVQSIR